MAFISLAGQHTATSTYLKRRHPVVAYLVVVMLGGSAIIYGLAVMFTPPKDLCDGSGA